jgi:hypothetical protein
VLSDRRRGIGLTIGFIAHNRTLKYNTTESLRTPSVFQLTTKLSQQLRSHHNRCNLGNRRTPGSLPSVDTNSNSLTPKTELWIPTTPRIPTTTPQQLRAPRYMTSGRTVEETVLLALIVQPSPGKRVPSSLGPARYQVTSTPWRARHNIFTSVYAYLRTRHKERRWKLLV